MADGSRVFEDLIVVATRHSLVSEEVDLLKPRALDEAQAIGFVPANGKHVKAAENVSAGASKDR